MSVLSQEATPVGSTRVVDLTTTRQIIVLAPNEQGIILNDPEGTGLADIYLPKISDIVDSKQKSGGLDGAISISFAKNGLISGTSTNIIVRVSEGSDDSIAGRSSGKFTTFNASLFSIADGAWVNYGLVFGG